MLLPVLLEGEPQSGVIWYEMFRQSPYLEPVAARSTGADRRHALRQQSQALLEPLRHPAPLVQAIPKQLRNAGRELKVPRNYDAHLTQLYGDWRTPDPTFHHDQFGIISDRRDA